MIEWRAMFDGILEACPAFRPAWDEFLEEWRDEPELPLYLVISDLARHMIRMLEEGDSAGLRRISEVVETWVLQGERPVREAAIVGLLEDLQNRNLHEGPTRAEDFVPYLLPESRYWWSKVEDFWKRGTRIVDDRGAGRRTFGGMKLEIRDLWSPDVDPPPEGLPPDPLHFCLFVQVAIGEVGKVGHEVFSTTVCSRSARAEAQAQSPRARLFVLESFDWTSIRERISSFLDACDDCQDWKQVVRTVSPFLWYCDAP